MTPTKGDGHQYIDDPVSTLTHSAKERLETITALWDELEGMKPRSPRYTALIGEIRVEVDAFRAIIAITARKLGAGEK